MQVSVERSGSSVIPLLGPSLRFPSAEEKPAVSSLSGQEPTLPHTLWTSGPGLERQSLLSCTTTARALV